MIVGVLNVVSLVKLGLIAIHYKIGVYVLRVEKFVSVRSIRITSIELLFSTITLTSDINTTLLQSGGMSE